MEKEAGFPVRDALNDREGRLSGKRAAFPSSIAARSASGELLHGFLQGCLPAKKIRFHGRVLVDVVHGKDRKERLHAHVGKLLVLRKKHFFNASRIKEFAWFVERLFGSIPGSAEPIAPDFGSFKALIIVGCPAPHFFLT